MRNELVAFIIVSLLSSSAFAWGRDGDVDYLVENYKKELKALQAVESAKEREKQAAINAANASVKKYQRTISSYESSIKGYENNFLTPTKAAILKKKQEADGYRNKLKEYKEGLDKAVKEQRFASKGFFGSVNGAADYKDMIEDAEKAIVEADKQKEQFETNLKKYEEKKLEYEAAKTAKLKEMESAKGEFEKAEGGLKSFREESKNQMASSTVPTLNAVVGQMVQRGENGSLEGEMLLRDLDGLALKLGLSKQELQEVFNSNPELRGKMGNTALGGYVNTQIASAMGSVCEYQAMCAAESAKGLGIQPEIVRKSMEHLHDSSRGAGVVKALGEKEGRDVAGEEPAAKAK